MIAYKETGLYNRYVRTQADEALREECITPDAHEAIYKAKEVKFYTPNFFVRIGLAILTLVITVFVACLLGLMFGTSSIASISFLLVFMGVACYVVAELLIHSKAHYNSGVDNMLVWMAALLVWTGIILKMDWGNEISSGIALSFMAFLLCTYLAARFADSLLSIAAALALLGFIFFCYQHTGVLAKYSTSFIMMLASGALYFVSAKAAKTNSLLLYRNCLRCVSIVALVALYGAGNYYLVRELSNDMFHLNLRLQDPFPMGWFFWIWTFVVPIVYIGAGIRNKNITLIRTGIPLIAVAVLTFRYYHSILAPELAMLLGGALLFVVAYSLINYLHVPRNGFTFRLENYIPDKPNIGQMVTNEFIDKAAGR